MSTDEHGEIDGSNDGWHVGTDRQSCESISGEYRCQWQHYRFECRRDVQICVFGDLWWSNVYGHGAGSGECEAKYSINQWVDMRR